MQVYGVILSCVRAVVIDVTSRRSPVSGTAASPPRAGVLTACRNYTGPIKCGLENWGIEAIFHPIGHHPTPFYVVREEHRCGFQLLQANSTLAVLRRNPT